MVVPFSNTKLRVPKGFQSLLVGLSTEILRSQPRNIHSFAADYFEKLLQRRDQGHDVSADKQSSEEDRYYNNKSFQEEYPVNRPDVNSAATKIQAQYRGHKTRRDLEKSRHENKQSSDDEEHQYENEHRSRESPNHEEHISSRHQQQMNDDFYPSPRKTQMESSSPLPRPASGRVSHAEKQHEDSHAEHQEQSDDDLSDAERKDRAAVAIQEQFRGFQTRKNLRDSPDHHEDSLHLSDGEQQEFDNDHGKSPTQHSARYSDQLDSDRRDLDETFERNDPINNGENDNVEETNLTHRSGRYSENSEKEQEQEQEQEQRFEQLSPRGHDQQFADFDDENDMNDPNLDRAATRIQASYRGYKTRKELSSHTGHFGSGHEHNNSHQPPSISPQMHESYDSARIKNILSPSVEGNRVHVNEEDDNAAATKIQAAYRGYRVRKESKKH